MKVIVVGPGAFGIKHLDGLKNIDNVEVVGLVGRNAAKAQAVADEYGIQNVYTILISNSLGFSGISADNSFRRRLKSWYTSA